MKKFLCVLICTIASGPALWADDPSQKSGSKPSEQPDHSIHTPAELVRAMRSAFRSNQSRAIHAKGIIVEGDFTPDLMLAIAASGPWAVAPTALDRFLDLHPSAKNFLANQKTPASFATISYFGLDCLKFTNAKGQVHYVRYQLLPEAGELLLADEQHGKVSLIILWTRSEPG